MAALRGARLTGTPLGALAFDSSGYLSEFTFNLYRVEARPPLTLLGTVRGG
jgi:hypothetical protein